MANTNTDQRLASIKAQYSAHYEAADWTLRYQRRDTAPCGCGYVTGRLGYIAEVNCPEFNRLSERLMAISHLNY